MSQNLLNEIQTYQDKIDNAKAMIENLKHDLKYQEELILQKDTLISSLEVELKIQKKRNSELMEELIKLQNQ
jgi:hypothetical protein